MKEECLICNASLVYLENNELMECVLCRKKENSKSRCVNGHYVCDVCHLRGVNSIIRLCLADNSDDPVAIIRKMMDLPFCHMHGPEHHIMVGSALLVAYKNAGGNVELEQALIEMYNRGAQIPGGACGFWGACGAGISAGIFLSIISGSTPLKEKPWGLSNKMTATALDTIGEIGGPRCCKRNSYVTILTAIDFVKTNFNIKMNAAEILCVHYLQNNQCLGNKCPFFPTNKMEAQ